jgi:hypothetical protein
VGEREEQDQPDAAADASPVPREVHHQLQQEKVFRGRPPRPRGIMAKVDPYVARHLLPSPIQRRIAEAEVSNGVCC